MTVILVLSTFVIFLLLDHFLSRRPAMQLAQQPAARPQAEGRLQPSLVGGFAGARVASRIPSTPLRVFMVVFGVGVSIYLFLGG